MIGMNQLAHASNRLRSGCRGKLTGQVFFVQQSPIGSDNRSRRGSWPNRVNRHHNLGFDSPTIDVTTQMICGYRDQPRRGSFMQIIPPNGFRRLSNHRFIRQNNLAKHRFNVPIDTTDRTL